MSEQSTQHPTPSPAATPAGTSEPTSPQPDEPMFPLPKMDLELRHGLYDREGD